MLISNVNVKDELIVNAIITALEGGSNYWYFLEEKSVDAVRKVFEKGSGKSLAEKVALATLEKGIKVQVLDLEDEEEVLGEISRNSIQSGLTKLVQEYPREYANIMEEEYDANDADVFLQLVVMNEVTFG